VKIAYQGAPGAFSHEACLAAAPGAQAVGFETFLGVFEALRSGACDRALVPVENSVAGPVPEVAELGPRCGFKTLKTIEQPIRIALIAAPDAEIGGLKVVESHPMALKQCGRLLAELGLKGRAAYDTAGAAQRLARSRDPAIGVLASAAAAELYGLRILRHEVQDSADNHTRFLLLARPAR
jgi:prephenate dehydratase